VSKLLQDEGTAQKTDARHTTISGRPVAAVYGPKDAEGLDYARDLGDPGQFPYTRGIHETMYRGKLWTMRQFAGYGSAAQTNARFKYLLEHGGGGLSVAFDLPTLMGRDPDHPLSLGEVGKCGVVVSSLADMETLFAGIPLDKVTTSMTINSPAAMLLAFYILVGEQQGVPPEALSGTVQADILKEFIAQKEYIYPPKPSMRIVVDMIRYCTERMPKWNTISISGYHIREAGATAAQELAFTLRDGIEYVQWCVDAGMDVDSFAPRLSFFFNSHSDFFEEIAKYRAARRIWARTMRERFGAKNPRSWMLRFHTQTAGSTLTAQQPENNIVRTALQALAAVLGGTQSLHTNSFDEALALPTEEAARVALRTQQIIACESGAPNTVDPVAGSYYIESLTDELERRAQAYLEKVRDLGGMLKAIERGYVQQEIQNAAYDYQQTVDHAEAVVVGVNRFEVEEEKRVPTFQHDPDLERKQVERLKAMRAKRDKKAWEAALKSVEDAARSGENLMPRIVAAVEAYCTVGEISDTLRAVFGEYKETVVI